MVSIIHYLYRLSFEGCVVAEVEKTLDKSPQPFTLPYHPTTSGQFSLIYYTNLVPGLLVGSTPERFDF